MKIKLAALLAVVLLGLAGCGSSENSSTTSNSTNSAKPTTNSTNATNSANTSGSTTPKTDGSVPAKAEATDEVGGTNEGCNCSAAGMKCSTKDGKGCCGKEGECSTMADGKSSCCSTKGSKDKACCSTAGKVAMNDKGAAKPEQKPATTGKNPS
ncbi:MAG TPA: hypothetical protein VF791_10315 [Pyrinomonadaceae bacterium]